ncbi:polysaccharide biosynthesis tyrosine autokinase [Hyalangium versicolor]|uniref:polysaccharide biosynthesis tyrosine autokinase n=1 Tax=Hyalangium versicolor TaxID=2861190 RepID=UPI001CCCF794|nr:polysaccharide biosynthesis tyrosine autokinase [Hyalangium versicolor]
MTSTPGSKDIARSSQGASDDELDLGSYLGILLEYRASIIVMLALTFLGGVLYLTATAPIYRASATLQIEQKTSSLGDLDQLLAHFSGETSTEIELLSSRTLLGRVADELHLELDVRPRYFPVLGAALARAHTGPGLASTPLWGLDRFAWGGERLQVERIHVPSELEDVPLTLVAGEPGEYTLLGRNSQVLLQGRVGSPAAAPPGLPQPVELLVSELIARPGTQFRVTQRSRSQVVEELQGDLRLTEKGLNTGILAATLEGEEPGKIASILEALSLHYVRYNVERRSEDAEKTLVFLDSQLPGLRQEVERAEAALSAHRSGKGNVDLGLEAQSILERSANLEKSISTLLLERSELRQRFTESHPTLVATTRKLARLRTDQAALNSQLKALPEAELESARLMRDVKVANELYLQLNNKAQEYRVLKASTVGNARIVDVPVVSRVPVRPSKPGVVAVSLVLGLTLGIALAFARQGLRRGVSSPAVIEAEFGVPVFATLPSSPLPSRPRRKRASSGEWLPILARTQPHDPVIESMRGLRTRLLLALESSRNNVIAITGPSPSVGKSFVSLNLACVLADCGKRVLLVDANLRGSWLHRCFATERAQGLSELLGGSIPLEKAIRRIPGQSLSFLPTGTLPSNPSELLLSARFKELVTQLSAEHDLVLIDTPPILAVTDAALVGRHAGVNLMVVRAGAHPMKEIAAALHRFEQHGTPVQGVILNGAPRSSRARAASGIYQYDYPTVS